MTYHTYELLKRRKNDPEWRKAHISAGNGRIIGASITINITIWGFVLWKKIESGDIEVNNIIDVLKSRISEFLN